jgi:hypothetical protein
MVVPDDKNPNTNQNMSKQEKICSLSIGNLIKAKGLFRGTAV